MQRMIRGGIILLIGLVVTIGTYEAASGGGSYVVAWGAIAFGGFDFVVGLFQVLGGAPTPVQQQAGAVALIHSMVALATADGDIKDDEVKTIRETFRRVTDKPLEEKVVRAVADSYLQGKIDLKAELNKLAPHMTAQSRNAVITGSTLLLRGKTIDQRERDRLVEIGTALDFSEEFVSKVVPKQAAAAA